MVTPLILAKHTRSFGLYALLHFGGVLFSSAQKFLHCSAHSSTYLATNQAAALMPLCRDLVHFQISPSSVL